MEHQAYTDNVGTRFVNTGEVRIIIDLHYINIVHDNEYCRNSNIVKLRKHD